MQVEIVTPRGAVYSGAAEEITAPGVMGEFGVLPGHIPFLTGLRSGVLRLRRGPELIELAVGPGYVQVGSGDRVIVLTEACETVEQIDLGAARRELEELTSKLLRWDREIDSEFEHLEARKAWAEARVEAKTGEYRNGGIGAREAPNVPQSPPNVAF